MPKVTVVIPLYNKGPHIEKTLCSVISQTIQDFEVIIIDGGSTDEGPIIIKKYTDTDSRIYLVQQKGKGVSDARNQGIYKATSDFIAFLDADDEWKPDHLETLLRLRKKYPESGIYTDSYKILCLDGELRDPNYKKIPPAPWEGILSNYFKAATSGEPPVWTSAVGIPKSIFQELGGFLTNEWWGEDLEMWGRIALKYPIVFSRNVGAIYHREAVNRTCCKKIPVEEHCFIKTALKAMNNEELSFEKIPDLKEYIASLEIITAIHNADAGYRIKALRILSRCKTKLHYKKKLLLIMRYLVPNTVINIYGRLKIITHICQ